MTCAAGAASVGVSVLCGNRTKCHLGSWVASFALPREEKICVGLRDVIARGNPQHPSHAIDPARRPFQLAKGSNRSFIDHRMRSSVAPLRPILFIPEGWRKPQRPENSVHLFAVVHSCFQFNAHLVTTGLGCPTHSRFLRMSGFFLMRQNPLVAILTQPEQFAPLAKLLPGQIVERSEEHTSE